MTKEHGSQLDGADLSAADDEGKVEHPTGEKQAEENKQNEPPA